MKRENRIFRAALECGVVCVLAAACGSGAKPKAAAGGADIADAGSEAGGAGAVGTNALCPAACATVRTCYWPLDLAACEAQCTKELAGSGYLARDVADEYFQILASTGNDAGCSQTRFGKWRPQSPSDLDPPKIQVADGVAMQPCLDARTRCYSDSLDNPGGMSSHACFLSYYRYSEVYRAPIRPCFAAACQVMHDCFCEHQLPGDPWVAIPYEPKPAYLEPTCPLPK
jgi:hypothetical protein